MNVPTITKILEKAVRNGIVTEFVAKNYSESDIVWFNGHASQAIRGVRQDILSYIYEITSKSDDGEF